MVCPSCKHTWDYRGKGKYAKCPKCKTSIPLSKVAKKLQKSTPVNEFDLLSGIPSTESSEDGEPKEDMPFFDVIEEKIESMDDDSEVVITKDEWIELVSTLSTSEYGELYQMFNDWLNETLKTSNFTMTEKRTNIIGKLTRKTLLMYVPKIKPYHLLAGILALSYGKGAFDTAKDRHESRQSRPVNITQVRQQQQRQSDEWVGEPKPVERPGDQQVIEIKKKPKGKKKRSGRPTRSARKRGRSRKKRK